MMSNLLLMRADTTKVEMQEPRRLSTVLTTQLGEQEGWGGSTGEGAWEGRHGVQGQ
jgi:hypothetical protein